MSIKDNQPRAIKERRFKSFMFDLGHIPDILNNRIKLVTTNPLPQDAIMANCGYDLAYHGIYIHIASMEYEPVQEGTIPVFEYASIQQLPEALTNLNGSGVNKDTMP